MSDPYETRHGPEYYADCQEATLDELGFDWAWYYKNRKEEEE